MKEFYHNVNDIESFMFTTIAFCLECELGVVHLISFLCFKNVIVRLFYISTAQLDDPEYLYFYTELIIVNCCLR